jgi:hypothetical protein
VAPTRSNNPISRRRRIPKSDVVRERLQAGARYRQAHPASLDAIADLIGSVDALPVDLSGRKKAHLRATAYGSKRSR